MGLSYMRTQFLPDRSRPIEAPGPVPEDKRVDGRRYAMFFNNLSALSSLILIPFLGGYLGQGEPAEASESKTGYFCPDCRTTVELTGIDLLRHQRKHQQEKSKPGAD